MGGKSVSEGGLCVRGARPLRWSHDLTVAEKRSGMVPFIRLPLVHLSIQQTVDKRKLCAVCKVLRTHSDQDTAPPLEELSRSAGARGQQDSRVRELSAQRGGRCPEWGRLLLHGGR